MNKTFQLEWIDILFSSFTQLSFLKKVEYSQLENGTNWMQVNND
jgi:hypothetical protein